MNSFTYEAVNSAGRKCNGVLDVADQSEALQRIRDMGLFPTRVRERQQQRFIPAKRRVCAPSRMKWLTAANRTFGERVKPAAVTVFTRQLATLLNAGLPLLRGLRLLAQQEGNRSFKSIIGQLDEAIEGGSSLSEALAQHPRVFNRLYVNMVRAGEASGALELTLRRLAEFQEKAQRVRTRIKSALFYPCAVMFVAAAILTVMMIFVVPRFQQVFADLMGGRPMPLFTTFVLHLSNIARHHALLALAVVGAVVGGFTLWLRTDWGRWTFDRLKLRVPVVGDVVRKSAIARFARTLGTLLGSGVPILQALTIVRETVGNTHVARMVSTVHDSVKEGDTVTVPLRKSAVFPPMIVGMVDVGEQTGALPDMLMKVADDCDQQVDDAVGAMTALLEPALIVFLALIVGSIVIAMFLPILDILNHGVSGPGGGDGEP